MRITSKVSYVRNENALASLVRDRCESAWDSDFIKKFVRRVSSRAAAKLARPSALGAARRVCPGKFPVEPRASRLTH